MTATLQINARGTLTLPKPMRKALGLEAGGVVMADVTSDGVVPHPAVSFPIELYTDARIAAFDAADAQLARRLKRKHA